MTHCLYSFFFLCDTSNSVWRIDPCLRVWNLLCKRNVCQEFSQLEHARSLRHFSNSGFPRSMWDAKKEQSTEYKEEVKRLHESYIFLGCAEFNQSDFDKPIIFVSLTIARIVISSLFLLSDCLVGSITASPCSTQDRLAPSTYSIFPFPQQPACHISQILTVSEWGPSERY